MTLGRIHSFETFGSVDGPGVRFVVFLQGCRLRCRYCHNPDTWQLTPAPLELEACDVLDRALRYRDYWGETGGITVSGGEPLLQVDFLTELFEAAKARGVHTAIDTAGAPFTRETPFFPMFERLMRSTDLVLLDLKHIDAASHKHLTGADNAPVLECARYLDSIGKDVWIRHVLVPGWTDAEDDLRRLGDFIGTLSNVCRVEVLPYHDYALFKWDELGIKNTLRDVRIPNASDVRRTESFLLHPIKTIV